MRIQLIGRSWKRLSFEVLPGHGDYFDWGFRSAQPPLAILELGRFWVTWNIGTA